MSPTSGEGSEGARGASSAALKGALLIVLAVMVGLFLLQRVDDDKSTAAGGGTTKPPAATTTTVARATTTTSTVPSAPPKSPAELQVIVLNGGAASGKAAELRSSLVSAGYTSQPPANNWEGHTQQGKTVLCKAGRQREAVALSQQTALQGSTIGTYPDPPPSVVPANNDCIVVVGS